MPSYFKADKWKVIKFFEKNPAEKGPKATYRVMCGGSTGYPYGQFWQMNSGIKSFEVKDSIVYFYGFSGSTYECHIFNEGFNSESRARTNFYVESAKDDLEIGVEVLNFSDFVEEFTPEVKDEIPKRLQKYVGCKLLENHFAVSKLMVFVKDGVLTVESGSGSHNETLYTFNYKY